MFQKIDKQPSILIVDDVPSNLMLLHEAVKGCGNVYFATNGEDAVSKAVECHPDIVLLDIEMPDVDGYEVFRRIQAQPDLDPAVIFVTGHDNGSHELKTLEAGGVDFIQKPINLSITRARVKTQLTLRKQTNNIQKTAEDMSFLVHTLPAFIAFWDGEGRNVFCNDVDGKWFNITASEMLGCHISEVLPKHSVGQISVLIEKAFRGIKSTLDIQCLIANEHTYHGQVMIQPKSLNDPSLGFLMLVTDITTRKLAEQNLIDEKERIRVTLNSIGDAVITTDTNGLINFMNPIAENMTGWLSARAIGLQIEEVMPLIDAESGCTLRNPVYIALEENRIVGMALNCMLGRDIEHATEVEDSAAPIRNHKGQVTGAIIVFHDVSATKAMAVKMTHLAQHDALTNLPNRLLLRDRIYQALKLSQGTHKKTALLMFDIDNFKDVNASIGHEGGDQLIKQIAQVLQAQLRPEDTLCRQGGDEFILLLTELSSSEQVMRYVSKIMAIFKRNWSIKQQDFKLTISIGASIYPEDSFSFDELYRHADAALFSAKHSGKNQIQFYSKNIEQKLLIKQQLENSLKNSQSEHGFEVFYQPKFHIKLNKIVGAEALVRWRQPDGTLVYPNDFIPLAEETGLIVPLGKVILHQACEQAAQWHRQGFNLKIAVNVSLSQFEDTSFLNTLKNTLEQTQLLPTTLELELTESVLAKDINLARQLVEDIRALGVAIALDDFGTGYSSLSYIKGFPLDVLKIDQSFVRNMLRSETDQTIIAAIIQMANGLNLKLIAEGVETQEHAEQLTQMGCEIMQGYLFSKPIPVEEFSALITQMNT